MSAMHISQRDLLDCLRRDREFLCSLSTTETRRRYRAAVGQPAYVGMGRGGMRTEILKRRYGSLIIDEWRIHG